MRPSTPVIPMSGSDATVDAPSLTAAARAAFAGGDLEAAGNLAAAALALEPHGAATLNLLGSIDFAAGRIDAAESRYRRALSADPSLDRARFNLGLVSLERGDAAGAIALIAQALAHGGSAEDHLMLGNLLHAEGRVDEALGHWRSATTIDPGTGAPWLNLGSVERSRGRLGAARAALEQAQALWPNSAAVLNELGLVQFATRQYAAAADYFRAAVRLEAGHVDARINLAESLRTLGAASEARAILDEVVRDHPTAGLAHKALGLLALTEARSDDAARHYRAASALLPEDPQIAHLLAAAEGRRMESAPPGYVRTLFDGLAARFDEELTQHLGYHTPEELAAALRSTWSEAVPPLRLADLGCGTGLVGVALAPQCVRMEGVDLSPRMLDAAQARGIYARLACGDLVAFLDDGEPARFDAIVAADVFIYVGRLDSVFAAAARALAPGGRFAFSLEVASEEGDGQALLRPSGRFAHRPGAIRDLAARSGFSKLVWRDTTLRLDRGVRVPGQIVVLAAA
jgi:predicted TPR repeat methyltransferase